MIIGAYFTFLNIVLEYGELAAWPMLAFVTSLPVAGLAVFGTWVARRMESTSWVMRFFLTELFAFAFLFFELFYYRAFDLSTLLQAFVPGGLVFFFFVVPSTLLYNRVMERWGVLPWHAVQWAVSFLSCLVFWALAIWVFRVFAV